VLLRNFLITVSVAVHTCTPLEVFLCIRPMHRRICFVGKDWEVDLLVL
jgi:hypothetical protein